MPVSEIVNVETLEDRVLGQSMVMTHYIVSFLTRTGDRFYVQFVTQTEREKALVELLNNMALTKMPVEADGEKVCKC